MPGKILIIDDEVDVMKMMVYRLEAKGFEVFTAINGKLGVSMAKAIRPDLIILDYRLPDMDANKVSSTIKEVEDLKHTPIILVTASIDNISKKAEECQATSYISKPVSAEELHKKVEAHIERKD